MTLNTVTLRNYLKLPSTLLLRLPTYLFFGLIFGYLFNIKILKIKLVQEYFIEIFLLSIVVMLFLLLMIFTEIVITISSKIFHKVMGWFVTTFARDLEYDYNYGESFYVAQFNAYSPPAPFYSLFLDYLLPYFLFFLVFFPLFLGLSFSLTILFVFILYTLFLVPFLILLAQIRDWEVIHVIIYTFSNPNVFKYIVIGAIYPAFYIVFLGILRYLVLGNFQEYHFPFLDVNLILYLIFFFPHILIVCFYFLNKYIKLRKFLFEHTRICFYSLHIYFLRNLYYYKFTRTLDKWNFALNQLAWLESFLNYYRKIKYPFIYKIATFIWVDNPNILLILVPLFLFLEIIMKGGIYYGFYFMFVFFCMRLSLGFFRKYMSGNGGSLQTDCSLSNYLNEKSWNNPYFPASLEYHCKIDRGIYKSVPNELRERWEKLGEERKRLPLADRSRGFDFLKGKFFPKRLSQTRLPLGRKIKLLYLNHYGIRWVHTGSSSRQLTTVHSILPHVLSDTISRLNLVSDASLWVVNYKNIQRSEVLNPAKKFNNLYSKDVPESISKHYDLKNSSIKTETEYNTLTVFSPLVGEGVDVAPHAVGNIYANKLSQKDPDVVFNLNNSVFKAKGLFALDLKASRKGTCSNIILGVEEKEYTKAIDNYLGVYGPKLSPEANVAVNKLKEIPDVKDSMFFYMKHLHLFSPTEKLPPLNIGKMVSEEYFSSEKKEIYNTVYKRIKLLSKLCDETIPMERSGNTRQQILKLMQSPEISAIMKDINEITFN